MSDFEIQTDKMNSRGRVKSSFVFSKMMTDAEYERLKGLPKQSEDQAALEDPPAKRSSRRAPITEPPRVQLPSREPLRSLEPPGSRSPIEDRLEYSTEDEEQPKNRTKPMRMSRASLMPVVYSHFIKNGNTWAGSWSIFTHER